MPKFTVVSLFAGCGGKDLGFVRAGFEVVWANDVDRSACASYRANLGDHIVQGDIQQVPSATIPEADLVIGGFPCQGFSIVGTRRLSDERNFLYREMKRVIRDKQPAFFVAENVRGLLNIGGGRVIQAMVREFEELGYCVDFRLLNARDFGVPQLRERVIIIGNRIGAKNPFPSPTHTNSPTLFDAEVDRGHSYRTIRDAIGDIEELGTLPNHEIDPIFARRTHYVQIMAHLRPGQKLCNVRLGDRSVYTWSIPEVFGETTEDERAILLAIAKNRRQKRYGPMDGNPLSVEVIEGFVSIEDVKSKLDSLVAKDYLVIIDGKYELKNAFNGIFRRLRWDEPSEAVLTVFHNPRYYVHPSQPRAFSVRELARIQSFPDDFIFHGPIKDQYTQVGNAVPPGLSEPVARGVLAELEALRYRPVREASLQATGT